MSNALHTALELAEEYGLPVFPCRADKKPYTENGFKDASKNIEQIAQWWGKWPDALIGVPTGKASKLLVVDVDPDGESWYSNNSTRIECGRIHHTRRGHHLLYRMPDKDIRNSASKIAPGIDVRGEGGYIIWWPGHGLQAVGDLADVSNPPTWLTDELSPKPSNGHMPPQGMLNGQRQGPGSRNSTLTALAGSMRRAGFSAAAINDALHKENFQRFDPPLPGGEVNSICAQAEKWEQGAIITQAPCTPIDWDALTGDPPPRLWWIQDWLGPWPMIMAGAGGSGKTRLWQAVATALATGRHYLEAAQVAPLNVLMWLCEDSKDETWRQQAAINAHFGLTMADLKPRLHIVPRQGLNNTLLDLTFGKPTFSPLLEELREQVNDLKTDVLVLDNVAQVFGANENDKHHTTVFVNGIAGVVPDRPFAPVFIGHTARAQGSEFSGSAAWENACRMRWYLGSKLPDQKIDDDEPIDPDVIYLARRKANYTSKDWRRLRFRNGLFVPEEIEGSPRFDQAFRDEGAERVVLTAFPRLLAMGLVPSDKAQATDYLPKQILAKGLAQNHSKKDLIAAMNRLMSAGKLRREKNAGLDSSRHPKPGLVMTP